MATKNRATEIKLQAAVINKRCQVVNVRKINKSDILKRTHHHHHHHHYMVFLEWPKQQCHHEDHYNNN